MRPRIPIPPELRDQPFHVRDGRAGGLGAKRLRGPDLLRPFHGVRGAGASAAHSYVPLLRPGDRFSHLTAAALWGIPLPAATSDDIHVTATLPTGRPRSAGVIGHTSARDASLIRNGLPVSDPVTLFIELGQLLSVDELVAVGDAMVLDPYVADPRDPRPWITRDDLAARVAVARSAGSRRARRAIALVRSGAESRPESLMRILLVHAGLPEPDVNVDVVDRSGRWIGRFDLVFRTQRVIVEYDGDQHRSSLAQYEKDVLRIERAQEAGWIVIRVRARALFRTPDDVVARVRRALAARP